MGGRRARVPGTPSLRRVAVRVTEDEHAALERLAHREGLDLADLLRTAALDWAAEGGDDLRGIILLRNRHVGNSSAELKGDPHH